jgi:hypothetical protein
VAVHNKKRVEECAAPQIITVSTTDNDETLPIHAVRFSHADIRSYKLILGDNPFAEIPLGLDWDHSHAIQKSCDEMEARQHDDPHYVAAQHMETMTVEERVARLRQVGYTYHQIRNEERLRCITLVFEWAYRCNRDDAIAPPCPNGSILFRRYVI